MRTFSLPKVIAKRLALYGPFWVPAARVWAGTRIFSPARRQTYTGAVAESVSVTRAGLRFLGLAAAADLRFVGALVAAVVGLVGAADPSSPLSPPICPMAISPPKT